MNSLSDPPLNRALPRWPIHAMQGWHAQGEGGRLAVTASRLVLVGSVCGLMLGAAAPPAHTQPPALIILHQTDQQLYFEIPRRTLDTDVRVQCTTETIGAVPRQAHTVPCNEERSGAPNGILTDGAEWHLSQRGDTVLVVGLSVLARFPIRRFGPDSAPVIDVSPLFLGAAGPSARLHDARAYPRRIEVNLAQPSGTSTLVRRWSLMQLPNRTLPLGRDNLDPSVLETTTCIRRLEKRDPWAASSDVVHPIVYYVDPHTPKQWVPYVKRGLEEWTPAFEAIGFRHAIVVREVPGPAGPAQDSAWAHLNDGRHDVVRWVNKGYAIPMTTGLTGVPYKWTVAGVTVADTNIAKVPSPWAVDISDDTEAGCDSIGIMKPATINLNEGSVRWFQEAFFSYTTVAIDPAVQHGRHIGAIQCPLPTALVGTGVECPVPDSLLGLGVQVLAAHEMGHALGLGHNFTGRWTYPTDSLHSRRFVERMGFTPTVMDYVMVNYFAQPSDDMPLRDLVKGANGVGPWDRWAIAWLYRPIPGAYTVEAEAPTLARWKADMDTAPYLRGKDDGGADEDFGADRIQGAETRLRTFARLATQLDFREQLDIAQLWIEKVRDPSYYNSLRDSASVVKLMQFYMDHLVLGRDPLLQAMGITWSTVPPGWDLSLWRWRQTNFTHAVFGVVQSLVDPAKTPSSGTRLGVCHVLGTTIAALTPAPNAPKMLDTISQAHTDSVRERLATIATQATCPPLAAR